MKPKLLQLYPTAFYSPLTLSENEAFALIFANGVIPSTEFQSKETVVKWFKTSIKEFQKVLICALLESGVPQEKAAKIPIGYHLYSYS